MAGLACRQGGSTGRCGRQAVLAAQQPQNASTACARLRGRKRLHQPRNSQPRSRNQPSSSLITCIMQDTIHCLRTSSSSRTAAAAAPVPSAGTLPAASAASSGSSPSAAASRALFSSASRCAVCCRRSCSWCCRSTCAQGGAGGGALVGEESRQLEWVRGRPGSAVPQGAPTHRPPTAHHRLTAVQQQLHASTQRTPQQPTATYNQATSVAN